MSGRKKWQTSSKTLLDSWVPRWWFLLDPTNQEYRWCPCVSFDSSKCTNPNERVWPLYFFTVFSTWLAETSCVVWENMWVHVYVDQRTTQSFIPPHTVSRLLFKTVTHWHRLNRKAKLTVRQASRSRLSPLPFKYIISMYMH